MSLNPTPTSVAPCPICGAALRGTADSCTACGAIREFGPTRAEVTRTMVIGGVAAPAITALLHPSPVLLVTMFVVGLVGGFYVAYSRHSVDRWVRPRR